MKKELTVQELANIWSVSVNTTWKRLNKLQNRLSPDNELLVIEKRMVNNREITMVSIDESILNEFNINNRDNNYINNAGYEDMLTDSNIKHDVNNPQIQIDTMELLNKVMNYSEQFNNSVNNIHNEYNQQLMNLHEQLMNEKSRIPLLEDKANREGLYLNEIKELKEENIRLMKEKEKIPFLEDKTCSYLKEIDELKKVNNRNKQLFTVIVCILTLLLITVTGVFIYYLMHPKIITQTETIIKEVPKEVVEYVKK